MRGGRDAGSGTSGSSRAGEVLRVVSIAAAYFAVARLSFLLMFEPEGIAAIWPPAGIFLSAVLLARRGLRPALVLVLAIADLLAERLAGTPWPVSVAYALALAGDASLSAWLLLRFLGGPPTFRRARDVVGFVLLSVLLSNGLWSLVAAEASQRLPGAAPFWRSWLWWAASSGIGSLLVTPSVLSWGAWLRNRPRAWNRSAAAEGVALLGLLAVVDVFAFARLADSSLFLLFLPYSTFPFLLWAALRLGTRGVATMLLLIAAITVVFAAEGRVTSIHESQLGVVIAVQLYLAVMAVPSLFLAAVVAERQQAEGERERLRGRFEETQRMEAVGRLSGGVAHDFNNMLTVILGHTSMALEKVPSSEPLHADLLEIQDAARRSTELTSHLLAFARRQTVAPKVLDLNAKIEDMLKMLRRLIGEDIDLAFRPGPGLWSVRIDPIQVDQILANLCVNARDAIGGVGRITIETANATLDEHHPAYRPGALAGDHVLLAVTDDGSGMTRDVREHVFEPFFTTKELGRGSGLGLATVYGIVKQNEGSIDVDSEPGRGSRFEIYLPRFAGAAARTSSVPAAAAPAARGETVLLVEDDASVRALAVSMLERLGYAVLVAGTPSDALRMAEMHAGDIHLLVADVVLPQMNGRQLADRIQSIRPGLRRLFVSGYTTDVIAHRSVLEEGIRFLQKPFSAAELAAKVRECLDEPDGAAGGVTS